MTNFTLGRIGLDADIDDVSQWDANGDTVAVSFSTPMIAEGGSLARSNAYRQMALGYAESPDQRFVPVTWADDPTADGYYRVRSVSVQPDPDLALEALYYFTVVLDRVQGYGMPAIQTTYLFYERTNVHSVSSVAYLGQPNAATTWSYAYEPEDGTYSNQSPAHSPSTSDGGSVGTVLASVSGGSGPNPGELALWLRHIDPSGYYRGSARLEVGGFPVEGRQVPHGWESNWRLTNGTSELMMHADGTSGGEAIFQMRGWNGSAWTDPVPITLLGDTSATTPRDSFGIPDTLTILKNTAEEVTIRFGMRVGVATVNWPVFLDITCRRGIRTFTCRMRRASGTGSANPGIYVPNFLTDYGWKRSGAWVYAGVPYQKNYIWNCRCLLDATYWDRYLATGTATGRITGVTGVGSSGITTAYRVTASAAHATTSFGVEHGGAGTSSPNSGLAAGTEYEFSAYVRCSVTRSLNVRVQWRNSSGGVLGTLDGGDVAVTANTWTRVLVTGTAPSSTARASMHVRGNSAGAAWTIGDTLDMTGLMADRTADVNTLWWDGEDSASDGFNAMYAWEAAPNCPSLKKNRASTPTIWITSPVATTADSDGYEPVVDPDPVSWDFGFGMMSTGLNSGDQCRYIREVQGYYMSISQTDDVVAV